MFDSKPCVSSQLHVNHLVRMEGGVLFQGCVFANLGGQDPTVSNRGECRHGISAFSMMLCCSLLSPQFLKSSYTELPSHKHL